MEVVVVLPCVPPTATENCSAHQLGQHLGAADQGNAARAAGDHLGIVRL